MPTATQRQRPKSPLDHDPSAIIRARQMKGLNQTGLAKAVGISKGHMSEIESGSRNAPYPVLYRIAQALDCPLPLLERKQVAA